jgi:hypothetical protein
MRCLLMSDVGCRLLRRCLLLLLLLSRNDCVAAPVRLLLLLLLRGRLRLSSVHLSDI